MTIAQEITLAASGDINPSRFVSISGNSTVSQSTANEAIIGISPPGAKAAPISGASTLAAEFTDSIGITIVGGRQLLMYGGTVVAGDRLKSDANGKGVAMATTGIQQNVGAYAIEGGSSGDIRMVIVMTSSLDASTSP